MVDIIFVLFWANFIMAHFLARHEISLEMLFARKKNNIPHVQNQQCI
jgi:hypothetical protein